MDSDLVTNKLLLPARGIELRSSSVASERLVTQPDRQRQSFYYVSKWPIVTPNRLSQYHLILTCRSMCITHTIRTIHYY